MRNKLVDASSCLEAENVDVVVVTCQCKALFSGHLAGSRDSTLANEETFATHELVFLGVYFV